MVADVDVRPRNVVVLEPGMIPKTPSGKLRRAHTLALVGSPFRDAGGRSNSTSSRLHGRGVTCPQIRGDTCNEER